MEGYRCWRAYQRLQRCVSGAAAGGTASRIATVHFMCHRLGLTIPTATPCRRAGYNCSLFAYGQTGAGKSYSMMGYGPAKGIIPIASEKIFERIDNNEDSSLTFRVEASMLEIYMEKVRDLFNPKAGDDLKIRLNPKIGFYVENLSKNAVRDPKMVQRLMDIGAKARTVASTAMNATSSRAHTIFQLILTQTKVDQSGSEAKATDKVWCRCCRSRSRGLATVPCDPAHGLLRWTHRPP